MRHGANGGTTTTCTITATCTTTATHTTRVTDGCGRQGRRRRCARHALELDKVGLVAQGRVDEVREQARSGGEGARADRTVGGIARLIVREEASEGGGRSTEEYLKGSLVDIVVRSLVIVDLAALVLA